MKVYFAAPLFSIADREYNKQIIDAIKANGFDIYAPQENTSINDKSKSADSLAIYDGDTNELKTSDILVCLLDGPVVDPGVAAEIGWFAKRIEDEPDNKNLKIFALFTDSRDGILSTMEGIREKSKMIAGGIAESQFPYVNLYVVGAVKKYGYIFNNIDDMIMKMNEHKFKCTVNNKNTNNK